jgi:hypothetical protein
MMREGRAIHTGLYTWKQHICDDLHDITPGLSARPSGVGVEVEISRIGMDFYAILFMTEQIVRIHVCTRWTVRLIHIHCNIVAVL